VLKRDAPIVIFAEPGAERESAMRLGRIGFDHVSGFLEDGLASAEARPDLIRSTERLSPERAAERLASSSPPVVIDVRTAAERAHSHIVGSLHIPLSRLTERLSEIPSGRPVLVHCAGGYRSSIAASLLQHSGRGDTAEIAGGMTAWEAAGLPV
jgi:hydroxyacylglutathione hydrolase